MRSCYARDWQFIGWDARTPQPRSMREGSRCRPADAPQTVHLQLMGVMAMEVGAALLEATHHDPRNGRAVVRNLADYHVPTMSDTPDIQVEWLHIPDPHISELGARGIGEIGCVGTAAAITNAVYHATDRRYHALPLAPI